MNKISIYVRTDLRTKDNRKVSNGKMASQAAHALMGSFLSMFKTTEDKLVLLEGNETLLNDYLNDSIAIEIKPIKSINEVDSIIKENLENSVLITDQGRTSFNEPTVTTLAVAPSCFNYEHFINCNAEKDSVYLSKQVLVINKEAIKDKWEMFEVVSKSSIAILIKLIKESDDQKSISLDKIEFKNWINGAFAKITVKPTTSSFDGAIRAAGEATANGVYVSTLTDNYTIKCIAFGADSIENIDKYTKEGFSLA